MTSSNFVLFRRAGLDTSPPKLGEVCAIVSREEIIAGIAELGLKDTINLDKHLTPLYIPLRDPVTLEVSQTYVIMSSITVEPDSYRKGLTA